MIKCGYLGNYFLREEAMLILPLVWNKILTKNSLLNSIKSMKLFNDRDFEDLGYTLKKPHKKKGKQ